MPKGSRGVAQCRVEGGSGGGATFSLTDCTSFAVLQLLGLQEAFTFDRKDFAAAGFLPLPAP